MKTLLTILISALSFQAIAQNSAYFKSTNGFCNKLNGKIQVVSSGTSVFTYKLADFNNSNVYKIQSNPIFDSLKSSTYGVTVTNSLNFERDTVIIIDNSLPGNADIEYYPSTTFCKGDSVKLKPKVTGTTYLWANINYEKHYTSQEITVLTSDKWFVSVYDPGCEYFDDITTLVNQVDTPLITLNSNTISSTSTAGYTWYLNGIQRPQFNNQKQITVSETGTYYVVGTNSLGCSAKSNDIFYQADTTKTTSIEEITSLLNNSKVDIYNIYGYRVQNIKPNEFYIVFDGERRKKIYVFQ